MGRFQGSLLKPDNVNDRNKYIDICCEFFCHLLKAKYDMFNLMAEE